MMALIFTGKEDKVKKGKLIRVELQPGRFVKMYEQDAIAQGLVEPPVQPKMQPAEGNKMQTPQGNKGAPPSPPSTGSGHSPEGGEVKRDDDLTTIEGIGKATARALQARGISTFEQLRQTEKLDFLSAQARQAIDRWREADVAN